MPLNQTETLYAAREIQGEVIAGQLIEHCTDNCLPLAYQPDTLLHPIAYIDMVIRSILKTSYLSSRKSVLEGLSEVLIFATANSNRCIKEIALSLPNQLLALIAPNPIMEAIEQNEKLINQFAKDGHKHAILTTLSLLQGEPPMPPLLFWRRDSLMQMADVSRLINGGYRGYLPTIIPNVDVKYYYQPRRIMPQLSLVVIPFDQPRYASLA